MTDEHADFRRTDADGVLTLTWTRDAKLNAVTPAMVDALRAAVDDLAEQVDARVLVITGEGRHFTAGMDITTLAAQGGGEGAVLRRNYRRIHLLLDEIEAVEKPVVLAAQGPCRGFGVELAASCDFRLCSDRAVFGLPEIANLAVLPGSGGISRLTGLVGPHWTKWISMAGQEVSAEQALTIGLVHAVHPDADFAAQVRAFAAGLTALSAEAMGLAKLGIAAAVRGDRASARDLDRIANTLLLTTPEHQARIAAFGARSSKR
jgi:enoyl-CoA hydratase/carnithine racemase